VPAASPDVETLALIASISVVVVPLVTLRPSHDADSLSVQVNVPPVGLVILNVWADGAVPPAAPEKLRLTGFRSMLGVDVVLLDVVVDVVLLEVVVAVPPDTTRVTETALA
jgi:hypothetical protein